MTNGMNESLQKPAESVAALYGIGVNAAIKIAKHSCC
jgi:hypothetical protein